MGYIWLDVTVLAYVLSAGFCSNWKTNKKAIQHGQPWIIYYILLACVQTSPLPQEKSGEKTSGYILRYSVFNREAVIKANKLHKTMQIVELGEAAYYAMNITEWCPLKSVSCKTACPMTICVLTKDGKENFLEDHCLYLLFLYLWVNFLILFRSNIPCSVLKSQLALFLDEYFVSYVL